MDVYNFVSFKFPEMYHQAGDAGPAVLYSDGNMLAKANNRDRVRTVSKDFEIVSLASDFDTSGIVLSGKHSASSRPLPPPTPHPL